MKYALLFLLLPFSFVAHGQCTISNAQTALEVTQSLEATGITLGSDLTFCMYDTEDYIWGWAEEGVVTVNFNVLTGPDAGQTGSYSGGGGGIILSGNILFTATFVAQQTGSINIQYEDGSNIVGAEVSVATEATTFLANLEQNGMTVGETVSAELALATGEFYGTVGLPVSAPQVLTAEIFDPSTDDSFTMPQGFETLTFFGNYEMAITAESVGTKVITYETNNGITNYSITVSPAALDPSPWEIIVADMVANNPHEAARSYDFTVGDSDLPVRLSENADCPAESGPNRFSVSFTDRDTGQEITVFQNRCDVTILTPGQNITVNFTPVSIGTDLLEWQDDNGLTQTAQLTSSATPCAGATATVASIGQDLQNNSLMVGETRSYCLLNLSPGSLIAMPAPTQNSGVLSATVTVLSGTDSGYSVEDYTGGGGGLQLSQGQNEFVRFDFTGVSAGPVLIEVETGAEFFEETITVLRAVLPVELTAFAGVANPKTTLLYFTTTTESQNAGFHLQHSTNGQTWSTLDFLPGAGDSRTEQHYEYTHQNPAAGINYYRLEQEDFDGTKMLSDVVTVQFNGVSEIVITPNPASEKIFVSSARLTEQTDYQLAVFDATGRQVARVQNTRVVDVAQLPQGVYIVVLNVQGETVAERFVRR